MDSSKLKEKLLYYENKLSVPQRSVSELLPLAHDLKPSSHHGTAKTLARLDQYHWKNKRKDVKAYVSRCTVCQQMKDHSGKKFTDSQLLDSRTKIGIPSNRLHRFSSKDYFQI